MSSKIRQLLCFFCKRTGVPLFYQPISISIKFFFSFNLHTVASTYNTDWNFLSVNARSCLNNSISDILYLTWIITFLSCRGNRYNKKKKCNQPSVHHIFAYLYHINFYTYNYFITFRKNKTTGKTRIDPPPHFSISLYFSNQISAYWNPPHSCYLWKHRFKASLPRMTNYSYFLYFWLV